MPTSEVLLDDRLLVAELTGTEVAVGSGVRLNTTAYWYYRACRAAVLGAGGQLSGPFEGLDGADQERAIGAMLRLPETIQLPDPRSLVPAMVDISGRHPRLNVMNVEAAAAALLLGARVVLSPPAANGALTPILDAEGIEWVQHDPGGS